MKKLNLLMLAWAVLGGSPAFAQGEDSEHETPIAIEPHLTLNDLGSQKHLEWGNTHYINVNTTTSFTLILECDLSLAKAVEEGTYHLRVAKEGNGTPEDIEIKIALMEPDSTRWQGAATYTMSEAGRYSVSCVTDIDVDDSNVADGESISFEVLNPVVAVPECDDYYAILGNSVELAPFIYGGYGSVDSGSWEFEWRNNDDKNLNLTPAEGTTRDTLIATNRIGTEVWERDTIPFRVHAGKAPELKIGYTANQDKKTIGEIDYIELGDCNFTLTLDCPQELAPAIRGSMKLPWGEGLDLSQSKTLSLTHPLDSETNDISGTAKWQLVQIRKTHLNTDGTFDTALDTLGHDDVSSNALHLYGVKKIAAAPEYTNYYVIEGKDLELTPLITGGYGTTGNNWEYKWSDEGGTDMTAKFTPDVSKVYTLTATNLIGSEVWKEQTIRFNVHTGTEPTLAIEPSKAKKELTIDNVNYIEQEDLSFTLTLNCPQELQHGLKGSMEFVGTRTAWGGAQDLSQNTTLTHTHRLDLGNNSIYGTATWQLVQTKNEIKSDGTIGQAANTVVVEEKTINSSDTLQFYAMEKIEVKLDKSDYHAIVEDPLDLVPAITGGYGSADNAWEYEWDSVAGEKTKTFPSSAIGDETHTLKATNYINGTEWDSKEFTFTIHTYDEPDIDIEGVADTTLCYPNKPSFTVNPTGGSPEAWTYEWKRDDRAVPGTDNDIAAIYNEDDTRTDVTYMVTAKNTFDSRQKEWSATRSITVHQYAQPKIDFDKMPQGEKNIFAGEVYNFRDSVDLKKPYSGGYEDGWVLKVYDTADGSEVGDFVEIQEGLKTYQVALSNKFARKDGTEEVWLAEEDGSSRVTINGLQEARISDILCDSTDIYAGRQTVLRVEHYGGLDNKWRAEWSGDHLDKHYNGFGQTIEVRYTAPNPEGDSGTDVISVEATCTTDSRQVVKLGTAITLRAWHDITFPTENSQAQNLVARENNTININGVQPSGGYGGDNGGWRYAWHDSDLTRTLSEEQDLATIPSVSFSSNRPEKRDLSYAVDVTNYGPTGNVWGSRRYSRYNVTVYHRPQTPVKLKRKGNGASRTMIVDTGGWLSENDLTANGYKFWYGYTNSQGEEIALGEPTTNLYYKFDSDSQYWNESQYWVCTVWDYEDGARVTSGKCYMAGSRSIMEGTSVDEDFDLSDFTRITRLGGDPSAIAAASAASGPVCAYIYQADGKLVRQYTAGGDKQVDTAGLKEGMYVVRFVQGGNITVRKIFVK